ncbi:Uu.00g077680.m01.CDS01 [Anthostomella pinea]|uniref:Uu.00g077680.m01.CDS01 n=1 Tax=Anthostomella pinea TaxID=933095 RepID=A0AAI8VL55_9PEZI|nr:Uu.00g077680.m01.CDS01 [Anthostomella pinea]
MKPQVLLALVSCVWALPAAPKSSGLQARKPQADDIINVYHRGRSPQDSTLVTRDDLPGYFKDFDPDHSDKKKYEKLDSKTRRMIDRAMEYAVEKDYKNATASWLSDRNKAGQGSFMDSVIMGSGDYTKSPEKYFEGLLGFFYT